jgi:predicted nucleic acid-binding protein
MNRIVIDTNVIISFLTDRNRNQQKLAAALFESALLGKHELVLHQIVATEVVYVLHNLYDRSLTEVAASIRDLIELPGVVVIDKMPWGDLFNLWPQAIESYADAALVAVTRSGNYEYLATFDRKLCNRLKDLGTLPYPFPH